MITTCCEHCGETAAWADITEVNINRGGSSDDDFCFASIKLCKTCRPKLNARLNDMKLFTLDVRKITP